MYTFKGFAVITSLASNSAGVIAPIGELSPISLTFSKDIVQLLSDAADTKSVSVYGFSSKSNQTPIATPLVISKICTDVTQWVHTRQSSLPSTDTKDDFYNSITAEFSERIVSLTCGDMITATNGKSYPSYIKFKTSDYAADDNLCTIWFSNSTFEIEYDEYSITVVPPIENIDVFFSTYSTAVAQINAMDFAKKLEFIQRIRSSNPETIVTSNDFVFYNATNSAAYVNTNWTYLIYGPKGNDPDAIKQATIAYLQANSTRELGSWKTIFPDIFKSTEFIIIPKWNNYSIDEMTLQAGIYSPIINLKNEIAYAKAHIVTDYSSSHIENNLFAMSHPYKSLTLLVIGGPDNGPAKQAINQVFKDIIAVSSTSNDFSRMSSNTMQFLNYLAQMLVIAEQMTPATSIPNIYKTTVRDGISYLVLNYGGINYFVASKKTTP